VRYVHEPRPGIAAARNRALAEAGDAEVLVFVDDDELPTPSWLQQLIDHWMQWRCTAVAGPVIPRFEGGEPDPWVVGCGVFDRASRPTGTPVPGAATNNLLLHLPQLRKLDLGFDEEFGLSGGSDSMLTRTMVKKGAVIRWCDEAAVWDYVPAARTTRSWVLKRSLRTGNGWSRVALALSGSPRRQWSVRLDLTLRGLVRIARGLRNLLLGTITWSIRHRAVGACQVATGVGVLLGAYGFISMEYLRRNEPTRRADTA
jgi:glycosyltransferase involved in cell wall biosynthesis